MCTCNKYCPKCDPGIEAFYQTKVEEAKKASAYLKTTGIDMYYEDMLDAKDIWYEYCALKHEAEVEDAVDELINDQTDLSGW